MKQLDIFDRWNCCQRKVVMDGFDEIVIPAFTEENFHILVRKHNELINVINHFLEEKEEKS